MLISINFRFPSHLLFNQFSMRILQPMCSAFRGLRWQFLGRQCFLPSTLTMTEDFSNGLSPLWHQPAERFLMPSSHPTVLTKYILTKDQKGERPAHPHGCCGLLLLLLKRTNTNHDVRAKAKNNSQAALLVPLESFSHDMEILDNVREQQTNCTFQSQATVTIIRICIIIALEASTLKRKKKSQKKGQEKALGSSSSFPTPRQQQQQASHY